MANKDSFNMTSTSNNYVTRPTVESLSVSYWHLL